MVKVLWLIFLLQICCVCFAQKPVKLESMVNSEGEESLPMVMPGTGLLFTRSLYPANIGGTYGGQDIWMAEWRTKDMKVKRLPFNTTQNEFLAGAQPDGRTLYFVRTSSNAITSSLYRVRSNGTSWTSPELISIPALQNEGFIGIYMSSDESVLLISMKRAGGIGEEDLYYSLKSPSGVWSAPVSLGATINSKGFEISPFLSPDKKRLYFSSNGHGGSGDADIFYADRLHDSWETWSAPVNLGEPVNSKKFDAFYVEYGDSVAFFASNRERRMADIYKHQLSREPAELIKGARYLNINETEVVIGKNVNRTLTLKREDVKLSGGQRELLYYIANKLQVHKDIRVHIVLKKEIDKNTRTNTLKIIQDALEGGGLPASRISVEQSKDIPTGPQTVIELMLYRL